MVFIKDNEEENLMGRMKCLCGNVMSDSTVPNDVRKWILKEDEWKDFVKRIDEGKTGWNFKLSVWYCHQCKRFYVSNEKTTKVFSVNGTENSLQTCKCFEEKIFSDKNSRIWVFSDEEWSNVRTTIKEGKAGEINPKSDVRYCQECQKVYVNCGNNQEVRIYSIEQEIKN
jgi:hypothetical protein